VSRNGLGSIGSMTELTEQDRQRTVSWADPAIGARRAADMDGLEFLRAMQRGEIPAPPIAALLGMEMRSVEPGAVTFSLPSGEHLYNPIGSVHGGVACTLLDTVMGCAVHSRLERGQAYTTLELKVNLVRAITTEVPLVLAEGIVVSMGRRVATATGQIVDESGRLYAHASTTCLVFPVVG